MHTTKNTFSSVTYHFVCLHSGSSRGPIHQQRDPPEQYEESKPRVLAKKTVSLTLKFMIKVMCIVEYCDRFFFFNWFVY